MRRRDFIGLAGIAAVGWPVFARAQKPTKIYRLGYLARARVPNFIEALQNGLRELGYVEGKNLAVEYRFGENSEMLDALAAELVALRVDVIVTTGALATMAANRATATIPIVMAPVGDPLRTGIVPNLSHPGGNVTGVTLYSIELGSKCVEVLKEAVPEIARLAILGKADNPYTQYTWEEVQPAAQRLGLELHLFVVREFEGLAAAFADMQRIGAGGVFVLTDLMFNSARRQIATLAVDHRLPSMYETREWVESGGLISYGPNIGETTHRAAAFVDKLLKGAKAGELPIERPTKIELVVNLQTAKALGLTIPPSLLAQADEVIE
jgi:putative ABC transport system substrate-binding protein